MPFEPHPASDLLGRPAGLQAIHDGNLQLGMHDQLAMDGPALLVHALGVHRVLAIQLWQFLVREEIPLQLAIDRGRSASQPIRYFRD